MNEIDKAVIIMYPDCRTTGGLSEADNGRCVPEGLLTEAYYRTVDKLLGRYIHRGFSVYGITYLDTDPDNFSSIYPNNRFDQFFPVSTEFNNWQRAHHLKLLNKVIDGIPLGAGSQVVVGGYHAYDCVASMVKVLLERKYSTSPDLRLTNLLGWLLVAHKIRNLTGSLHLKEDREMERLYWANQYQRLWALV